MYSPFLKMERPSRSSVFYLLTKGNTDNAKSFHYFSFHLRMDRLQVGGRSTWKGHGAGGRGADTCPSQLPMYIPILEGLPAWGLSVLTSDLGLFLPHRVLLETRVLPVLQVLPAPE